MSTELPAVGSRVWVVASGAGPFFVLDTSTDGVGHYEDLAKKKWVRTLDPPCVKVSAPDPALLAAPVGSFAKQAAAGGGTWIRAQFLTTECPRAATWDAVGAWLERHGRRATSVMLAMVALHLSTALVAWSAWTILKQAREEMRRDR